MASSNYNTISIKVTGVEVQDEAIAAGTITPGMLIEEVASSSGEAKEVQAHSVVGQQCAKTFAIEDELQGHGIDTDYSANDRVQYRNFLPGTEVYALIADGEDVDIGDRLVSAGNGMLQKQTDDSSATTTETHVVAIAQQAVNMASSSGVDALVDGVPGSYGRCVVKIV